MTAENNSCGSLAGGYRDAGYSRGAFPLAERIADERVRACDGNAYERR